jgi:hypothetical protein
VFQALPDPFVCCVRGSAEPIQKQDLFGKVFQIDMQATNFFRLSSATLQNFLRVYPRKFFLSRKPTPLERGTGPGVFVKLRELLFLLICHSADRPGTPQRGNDGLELARGIAQFFDHLARVREDVAGLLNDCCQQHGDLLELGFCVYGNLA